MTDEIRGLESCIAAHCPRLRTRDGQHYCKDGMCGGKALDYRRFWCRMHRGGVMTPQCTFEGVTINIPAGTILTATEGAFIFKSALTENYYTCKKAKYLGDGCWDYLGEKIKMDIDEEEVRK